MNIGLKFEVLLGLQLTISGKNIYIENKEAELKSRGRHIFFTTTHFSIN